MVTSWVNAGRSCRSRQSGFNEIYGRHDWTRTSDLYRVKSRTRPRRRDTQEVRVALKDSVHAVQAHLSSPLTCPRATPSKLTRDGQGSWGYDTTHDTNFPRVAPALPLSIVQGYPR